MIHLLLTIVLASPAPKTPPAPEPIVGTWRLIDQVCGGRSVPLPAAGRVVEFTSNGRQTSRDGEVFDDVWTYRFVPGDRNAIDLFPPRDHEALAAAHSAIYRIDGDRMTICVHVGGKRPTAFHTSDDSKLWLLTYTRQK